MYIDPILSYKNIELVGNVTLITNPVDVCENFNIDVIKLILILNQNLNCISKIISGEKYIIITQYLDIADIKKIFTKYARFKNKNYLIREIYKLDIFYNSINKIASSSGKDVKLTSINKIEDVLLFFKTDINSFVIDLEKILNCNVYEYDVNPLICLEGHFDLEQIKECLIDKVLITEETFIPKFHVEICRCCEDKMTIFKNYLIVCKMLNISIEQLVEKFKDEGFSLNINSGKTEFIVNHCEISAKEIKKIIFKK